MRIKLLAGICLGLLLSGCCHHIDTVEPILKSCVTEQAIAPTNQIVFFAQKQPLNPVAINNKRIVFTKSVSAGSGSYSIYKTGNLLTQLPTTYEFICNGRLYGYNAWNWKFYEINYDATVQKFYTIELNKKELEKLFEGIEVVPLSQMKKNELTIDPDKFMTANVLVWNDTNHDFYRYSFEGDYKPKSPFPSILNIQNTTRLKYSHFGADNNIYPALTIEID